MNRRLRIGVSARIQYGDAAKPGYLKKNIYYLEQSFARWLQSAGALVYLVPDVVDRDGKGNPDALSLADYAAELDGLVLQGGTDISPQMYGEAPLRPEW
ncbi:MAG: gamma-glutamyl-gamma-aminobutyrate hydrolase family protein, partial [Chthoniobacteraceae bacterium]